MYHHIQDGVVAAKGNYQSLNVDPGVFRAQMEYIKNNYTAITFSQLAAFFDNGTALPAKPIIITFDDGYVDLYVNALPIMRDLGLHATVFTITGLNNNPAYLTWDQISEMAGSGLFAFGNHTWSHHNLIASEAIISTEIDTAQNQLIEKGLNNEKIFAYPYGAYSNLTIKHLQTQGYSEAVTTHYGTIQCKSHRLTLSRIRIGNGALSAYGL